MTENEIPKEIEIVEMIDVEEYARLDKKPTHAKKYLIRIDHEKYEVHKSELSGREILDIANKKPAECYLLFQKIKGHEHLKKIELNEEVDLKKPGIEMFETKQFDGKREYFLDDEPYTTTEKQLTSRQILIKANLNPDVYYIKEIIGDEQISYKDKLDLPIDICPGLKFVSVNIGPMPVS
jgi:hypothetical protein